MKNAKMTICLMAAALFITCGQGFGLTEFKDGGTHIINYQLNDDVRVDYLTPGMQTTVNLTNGGNIPTPYDVRAYGDSRLNIAGGKAGDFVEGYDHSWITVSGNSEVRWLSARNNGRIAISGGSIGTYVEALDDSHVTMSGGSVGQHFYAYNHSYAEVSGGTVNQHLLAYDYSNVTMSGGTVGDLYAQFNSQVLLSGGIVNTYMRSYDSSRVTMIGGKVNTYLYSFENSRIDWSGGIIQGDLRLDNMAILKIYGSNFAIGGTPVNFGEIASISGGFYTGEASRQLTGILANGDMLNNAFRIGGIAKIVLVPEPATILLLTLGGLILRKKH